MITVAKSLRIDSFKNKYYLFMNDKHIGNFECWHEQDHFQVFITEISIKKKKYNVKMLEEIINSIILIPETEYGKEVIYVFDLFGCEYCNKFKEKLISHQKYVISKNDKIILVNTPTITGIFEKECDIVLGIDKKILKMGKDDNVPINPIIKSRKESLKYLSYKRKFNVTKIKKTMTSGKSYNMIRVLIDKPIIIVADIFLDDVYMKFIVNDVDYTSETEDLGPACFSYRLNKLCKPDGTQKYDYIYGYEKKLIMIITGFEYFKTNKDYIIYHDNKPYYKEMILMMNNIYSDHK